MFCSYDIIRTNASTNIEARHLKAIAACHFSIFEFDQLDLHPTYIFLKHFDNIS